MYFRTVRTDSFRLYRNIFPIFQCLRRHGVAYISPIKRKALWKTGDEYILAVCSGRH